MRAQVGRPPRLTPETEGASGRVWPCLVTDQLVYHGLNGGRSLPADPAVNSTVPVWRGLLGLWPVSLASDMATASPGPMPQPREQEINSARACSVKPSTEA